MKKSKELEEKRLADLQSYKILDTLPEKELDDLAEIASAICDTPISLITFLDEKRQWFKAKKGLGVDETSRQASFCQYTLNKPEEILVVNDALKDNRFKDTSLVIGDPRIRFYAGAPLKTPGGNVLGSLCVIDKKPREISEKQKRALTLLAQKVMNFLDNRKTLIQQERAMERKSKSLIKLTNNIPAGIFQLRMSPDGKLKFIFLSQGMKEIHPSIDLDEWIKDPTVGYTIIHPEDLSEFIQSLEESYKHLSLWYHEYRVKDNNGFKWHVVRARPEKQENGTVEWYGSFQDISKYIEYEEAMEQISFDISHILRKPVTSLLGLTNLMTSAKKLNEDSMKEYSNHIDEVAKELEEFTNKLNDIYSTKKKKISGYYKNTYGSS
jgi:hypothetical protein